VAGWTTELDWSDSAKMVNAPTGLLLGDGGLAGCMRERLSTISTLDLSKLLNINAPNDLAALRSNMVTCVDGITQYLGFVRPGDNDYDWTNEAEIDRWTMAKMETELGPEPDSGATNGPVSAEWVKWWYDALNLLTHAAYVIDSPIRYSREGSGATFSEAKDDFADSSWFQESSVLFWYAIQSAFSFRSGSEYSVTRERSKSHPSFSFSPGGYENNYKISAWAQFTFPSFAVYENPDYPCNKDTYAKTLDEPIVQSGEYDTPITVGDFDTITVSDPGSAGIVRGYQINQDSFLGFLLRQLSI